MGNDHPQLLGYTFCRWKAASAVMAYWHAVDKHVDSPPVDRCSGWSIYLHMLKIRLETVRVECIQHTYTVNCPWNQETIQSHYLSTTLTSAKPSVCQTVLTVLVFWLVEPVDRKLMKMTPIIYNSLLITGSCIKEP